MPARPAGAGAGMGKGGMNWDRPGLQSLLADVKKGNVDAVFVTDFDRLSRDVFHLEKIEGILRKFKCDLVTLICPQNDDPEMPAVSLRLIFRSKRKSPTADLDGLRKRMEDLGLHGMTAIVHSIVWRAQNEGLTVIDGIDELLKFESLFRESGGGIPTKK